MKLYHNPLSSCSQKVRMVLHEKKLSWESQVIDLQKGEQFTADYLALNPNAVVPTLEDQGHTVIESTLINEYLDDAYADITLKPANANSRYQMRYLTRRIDDALHGACGVITYAIGVRPSLMSRPREEVDALINKIPDPSRRETRRSVVQLGVQAPEFVAALNIHSAVFDLAASFLQSQPWLAGESFSLADCALMPYALRADHLGLANEISDRPALSRWYDAIRARPAFTDAVTAWLPEPAIAGFLAAGDAVANEIASLPR
tara:strand:- start:919 stop:1701 length:783 start_codon:yes stop_codon:yes gene_type:complete